MNFGMMTQHKTAKYTEKYSTLSRVLLAKLPHHFVAFDVCGSKNFPVPFVYLPWSMRKVAAQLGMV
jgi:hypothetical protein